MEAYRLGWSTLEQWKLDRRDIVQIYIEELREALLDLKQATLAEDRHRALNQIEEVMMLIREFGEMEGD